VGVGFLDAAGGEPQLVELDAARFIERKTARARREAAILAGQDLRLRRPQHQRTRLRGAR